MCVCRAHTQRPVLLGNCIRRASEMIWIEIAVYIQSFNGSGRFGLGCAEFGAFRKVRSTMFIFNRIYTHPTLHPPQPYHIQCGHLNITCLGTKRTMCIIVNELLMRRCSIFFCFSICRWAAWRRIRWPVWPRWGSPEWRRPIRVDWIRPVSESL